MAEGNIRQFVVFVDTNAIHTKPEDLLLFPSAFREQWIALAAPGDLALKIPEVALEELAFQKYNPLLGQYQHARGVLANIQAKLLVGMPDLPDAAQVLRKAVTLKLREQTADPRLSCEVQATPYQAIGGRLTSIIENAVWRLPPFKNNASEEGFRDAIILETVCDFHARNLHSDIALITKDGRLKQAADDRFRRVSNFAVFESIGDYGTFLQLARARFAPEFIHEVTGKAHDVFIETVWDALGIHGYLTEKYNLKPGILQWLPVEAQTSTTTRGLLALESNGVQLIGSPEFRALSTVLLKVVGQAEFHWSSRLLITSPYAKLPGILSAPATEATHERVVLLALEWASTVADDHQFSAISLLQCSENVDSFTDVGVLSPLKAFGVVLGQPSGEAEKPE